MSKYKYFDIKSSLVTDKNQSIDFYVKNMLNRTQSMFKYSGLPDTIPSYMLELYLQTNGSCVWAKHEEDLYVFIAGLGGIPDAYYQPTRAVVSDPALNLTKEYTLGVDAILMRSDTLMQGLLPIFNRYASLLVENDITIRLADINLRQTCLISASDDITKKSADFYLEDVKNGRQGVIAESAFLGGIKMQNVTAPQNYIGQLIELEQYLKSGWYNDIGLQSNFNMKRESLNSSEVALNNDILMPLVDNMLHCRQMALEEVNKKFNTNITVSLNSSWATNKLETRDVTDTAVEDGGVEDGKDYNAE